MGVFSKENKRWFEERAIIKELPTCLHLTPESFRESNRIIAGMPLGIVIAEDKQYTSSITARRTLGFGPVITKSCRPRFGRGWCRPRCNPSSETVSC